MFNVESVSLEPYSGGGGGGGGGEGPGGMFTSPLQIFDIKTEAQ